MSQFSVSGSGVPPDVIGMGIGRGFGPPGISPAAAPHRKPPQLRYLPLETRL